MLKAALPLLVCLAMAAPAMAQDLDGAALFTDTCGACHQPDGSGIPGIAPPVADPALWQHLGEQSQTYAIAVILGGLTGRIEAAGQTYIGLAMPPHDWMSDGEVAAVATYLLDLNEVASEIAPEDVAALRDSLPSHAELRAMRP